jgi:hypothetical protein
MRQMQQNFQQISRVLQKIGFLEWSYLHAKATDAIELSENVHERE